MKKLKKSLFLIGRLYTLLSVLFTVSYVLWDTVYPVYQFLSRNSLLSVFYFDDAIIMPFGIMTINLILISVFNLMFFRREMPMYDQFLSLIQMPLLVFGSSIAVDIANGIAGRSFTLWQMRNMTPEKGAAQAVILVFLAVLLLFSALVIHSTRRYIRQSAARGAQADKDSVAAREAA